jgi:hypothetical protein
VSSSIKLEVWAVACPFRHHLEGERGSLAAGGGSRGGGRRFLVRELRSGIFFLGLALFVMWESLRVGLGTLREPGSGFLSFCAGALLFAFSWVHICRGWRIREEKIPLSRRVVLALVLIFAYGLVLNTLGFIVATFFFLVILFRLGEPRPWWFLLGASTLTTFLFYLVFGILLHVYFPRGYLVP